MRVLVIDPYKRNVEERHIPSSPRELQKIASGFALVMTFPHNGKVHFVAVNELPASEFHFKLGAEHVFSGFGVIFGCDNPFNAELESTDLSVAEIRAITTFFSAPRPPMGWVQ